MNQFKTGLVVQPALHWYNRTEMIDKACMLYKQLLSFQVPAQRGWPSGLQHVPWGSWQRLLLGDWRLIWTDPWAQRGAAHFHPKVSWFYWIMCFWELDMVWLCLEPFQLKVTWVCCRWLNCLWPTQNSSSESESSLLKAACCMDHQVGRLTQSAMSGRPRPGLCLKFPFYFWMMLDISHETIFRRNRKDASGPSSGQSAGLQLPEGEYCCLFAQLGPAHKLICLQHISDWHPWV